MNPRVSVLLSVYNGEEYIKEAVESILNQTFQNFEFIIIDDGCTDDTALILNSFNDPRIVRVVNEKNLGLVRSLNKGLRIAKGEFIARMDADDTSTKDRLEKQVAFLDANKDVGVLGTWMKQVDSKGKAISIFKVPVSHDEILWQMLSGTAIVHASVLMRRDVLMEVGGYNEDFPHVEDTELWSRLIFITRFANLSEVLYIRRIHNNSIMSANFKLQIEQSEKIREKLLLLFLEKNMITAREAQKVREKQSKNNIFIGVARFLLPAPFRHKLNSSLHRLLSYFTSR